jgi:hypothetical protein
MNSVYLKHSNLAANVVKNREITIIRHFSPLRFFHLKRITIKKIQIEQLKFFFLHTV